MSYASEHVSDVVDQLDALADVMASEGYTGDRDILRDAMAEIDSLRENNARLLEENKHLQHYPSLLEDVGKRFETVSLEVKVGGQLYRSGWVRPPFHLKASNNYLHLHLANTLWKACRRYDAYVKKLDDSI